MNPLNGNSEFLLSWLDAFEFLANDNCQFEEDFIDDLIEDDFYDLIEDDLEEADQP